MDGENVVTASPAAMHVLTTPDVLARVVDLQPIDNGRIWVLNSTDPYFVLLGPDGRVERQFGSPGGGPEEFGAPVALVLGPEPGEVWTYDVPRNALIRISEEVRREVRLPLDSLPPLSLISFQGAGIHPAPLWLQSSREGFLLARVRPSGARSGSALALWHADILLVKASAPRADIAVHTAVADLLRDPSSRYGAATTMLPYPLWTVCADGTVALYDPLGNSLRRFTGDGQELAPFALPSERRLEITADRVFGMFYRQIQEDVPAGQLPDSAEMRHLFEESFPQLVHRSAGIFPEYADLRCTSDGMLWLRSFDVTTGRLGWGSDWHRFSADGSRTLVMLPREFRTFRIDADRIWGTVQDSLGFESIVWIGLDS